MSTAGKWLVKVGFALGLFAAVAELLSYVPLPYQPGFPTLPLGLGAVALCLAGLVLRGDRKLAWIGAGLGLVPWAFVLPAIVMLASR